MAENKTQPTTTSAPAFLDAIPDEAQRGDAKALAKLMQKVTGDRGKRGGRREDRGIVVAQPQDLGSRM